MRFRRKRLSRKHSISLFVLAFTLSFSVLAVGSERLPPSVLKAVNDIAQEGYLAATTQSGTSLDCNKRPSVDIHTPRVDYDLSRSRDAPDGLPVSRQKLVGQTNINYGYAAELQFKTYRTGLFSYCTIVDSVSISTSDTPPKIWISSLLDDARCPFREALKHEIRHVENFRSYTDGWTLMMNIDRWDYASLERSLVQRSIRNIEDDKVEASEAILHHIDQIHRALIARSTSMDAAMDTPEEYSRIEKVCR